MKYLALMIVFIFSFLVILSTEASQLITEPDTPDDYTEWAYKKPRHCILSANKKLTYKEYTKEIDIGFRIAVQIITINKKPLARIHALVFRSLPDPIKMDLFVLTKKDGWMSFDFPKENNAFWEKIWSELGISANDYRRQCMPTRQLKNKDR